MEEDFWAVKMILVVVSLLIADIQKKSINSIIEFKFSAGVIENFLMQLHLCGMLNNSLMVVCSSRDKKMTDLRVYKAARKRLFAKKEKWTSYYNDINNIKASSKSSY